jgi:23S rRNA G2445 N2-methylase RlmL
MERQYFAACTLGLEDVLASELRELGARDVRSMRGGAHFTGDLALGYSANLWLRTAIRIQETLTRGDARNRDELYRLVGSLDWSRHMTVDQTLAVDASIRDTFLTDSRFAGQIVKDAVVDQFRKRLDKRPSVDRKTPDLPLKLHLRKREATLYRDLTGASLHKRGYRPIQVKSPLNEALAAGMLLISEWDRQSPLLDPMCGSGTIAIEAALLSGDRAPGIGRLFAFELWPDHDEKLWNDLRNKAEERAKAGAANIPPIEAADRHGGALSLARQAARSAGVSSHIHLTQSAIKHLEPSTPPKSVYVNPPYGERIGAEDLVESWHDLGAFLRERCKGAAAFVLSGNPELTRHLGLRAERKWPLHNGPIDCRLLRYVIR